MARRERSRWTDGEHRKWIQWGIWTRILTYHQDARLFINCGCAIWICFSVFVNCGRFVTHPRSFCTSLGVNCNRFVIIWTLLTSLGAKFYLEFIKDWSGLDVTSSSRPSKNWTIHPENCSFDASGFIVVNGNFNVIKCIALICEVFLCEIN